MDVTWRWKQQNKEQLTQLDYRSMRVGGGMGVVGGVVGGGCWWGVLVGGVVGGWCCWWVVLLVGGVVGRIVVW